jgi:diacylglycerol kinase family enzyme
VRYLLIENPASGPGEGEDVWKEARRRLGDVEVVRLDRSLDLGALVSRAISEERVVVAGGGDGTVSALAQHLVGRGTLGILPAGTRNHFARNLGIGDPDTALEALAGGRTRRIDVGRADDRVFVNSVGMGLYPEGVRERERREPRQGRWAAAGAAALAVLRRARPLVGTIAADGDARALLAWVVFVGNNRFGGRGSFAHRPRLDEGVLDLRILTLGRRRARRAALAWRVLRGRPWETRRVVRRTATRVELRITGGARLVSRDGEAGAPTDRLSISILPAAMEIVAPGGT